MIKNVTFCVKRFGQLGPKEARKVVKQVCQRIGVNNLALLPLRLAADQPTITQETLQLTDMGELSPRLTASTASFTSRGPST